MVSGVMAISNLQTVNRSLWQSRPRSLTLSRGEHMTVAKVDKNFEVQWWVDLGGDYTGSAGYTDIAVNGDYVYVTGWEDGNGDAIWCIDQSDGSIAWSAGRNASDSTPSGYSDRNWGVEADSNGCYVFSNKYIYHLNTSGTLQWETDLNYSLAEGNCSDSTYIYGATRTSTPAVFEVERVNKSGTVVNSWTTPLFEDITTDGTYLWGVIPTNLGLYKYSVTGTLQWNKSSSDFSGIGPTYAVTNDSGNAYCFGVKAGPTFYIIKVDSSGSKQWEYEIPNLFPEGGIRTDGSHIFACGGSDDSTADISGTSTLIKLDMDGNYVTHKSGFSVDKPGEHAAEWRRMELEGDYIYLIGSKENAVI